MKQGSVHSLSVRVDAESSAGSFVVDPNILSPVAGSSHEVVFCS